MTPVRRTRPVDDTERAQGRGVSTTTDTDSVVLGNDKGRRIRLHRSWCRAMSRQVERVDGIAYPYPDPDVTVPAISLREVAA